MNLYNTKNKINGHDLLRIGWQSGPELGEAIKKGNSLIDSGMSKESVLSMKEFKNPPQKTFLRPSKYSKELSIAMEPERKSNSTNYNSVVSQMTELMKMPRILRGTVMPDACPTSGDKANITVGGAIIGDNAIFPGAHSADICCSMFVSFFTSKKGISEMMNDLQSVTRFGRGFREEKKWVYHSILEECNNYKYNTFLKGNERVSYAYMADQGDGNHFSYIGQVYITQNFVDELIKNGYVLGSHLQKFVGRNIYALVSHHGSRGLGSNVYKKGMKEAEKYCKKICKNIPKSALFLDYNTDIGHEYWDALQHVKRWTYANHQSIHNLFLNKTATCILGDLWNEHNFVWKRGDHFYHGKGATPAWTHSNGKKRFGIIPLNMGREILIVLGSDNDQYLSFAPHGAGRNVSRSSINRDFEISKGILNKGKVNKSIEEQTKGLDIRWYCGDPDISETPMAYKDPNKVKKEIEKFELAEIISEIKPLGAIMAGDQPKPWRAKKKSI